MSNIMKRINRSLNQSLRNKRSCKKMSLRTRLQMRSLNKNWRERRWKKKNKVKLMKSSQIHKNKNRVNQKKNIQKNRERMLGYNLLKLVLNKIIQSKSKKKMRQNLSPMEAPNLKENYKKRQKLKTKNTQRLKTKNKQSKRKIQKRQKMKQNKMTSRYRMKSNLQNLTRILNPIQRIQMRNQTAAEGI